MLQGQHVLPDLNGCAAGYRSHRVAQGDQGRAAASHQRDPGRRRWCFIDNETFDRGHRPGANDRHLRHRLRHIDGHPRSQAPGILAQDSQANIKVIPNAHRCCINIFLNFILRSRGHDFNILY